MKMAKSLDELRGQIERQVPNVGLTPYSNDIIALALGLIERDYGHAEANRAIEDFGLDMLGWSKVDLAVRDAGFDEAEAKIDGYRMELRAALAQVQELSGFEDSEQLEMACEKAADIVRAIRQMKGLRERGAENA
jgi:hypothetical protein